MDGEVMISAVVRNGEVGYRRAAPEDELCYYTCNGMPMISHHDRCEAVSPALNSGARCVCRGWGRFRGKGTVKVVVISAYCWRGLISHYCNG